MAVSARDRNWHISRGDELFLSNLERFAAGDRPLDLAVAGC
jgi:hypothetical protein